jgi:hypothetical protein
VTLVCKRVLDVWLVHPSELSPACGVRPTFLCLCKERWAKESTFFGVSRVAALPARQSGDKPASCAPPWARACSARATLRNAWARPVSVNDFRGSGLGGIGFFVEFCAPLSLPFASATRSERSKVRGGARLRSDRPTKYGGKPLHEGHPTPRFRFEGTLEVQETFVPAKVSCPASAGRRKL